MMSIDAARDLFAVLAAMDYGRPVLDPSTVFDKSGPFEAPLTDELLRHTKSFVR
jgi:hypothetical protein